MRRILEVEEKKRGAFFDKLRKEYPVRREFRFTRLELYNVPEETQTALTLLGFTDHHRNVCLKQTGDLTTEIRRKDKHRDSRITP